MHFWAGIQRMQSQVYFLLLATLACVLPHGDYRLIGLFNSDSYHVSIMIQSKKRLQTLILQKHERPVGHPLEVMGELNLRNIQGVDDSHMLISLEITLRWRRNLMLQSQFTSPGSIGRTNVWSTTWQRLFCTPCPRTPASTLAMGRSLSTRAMFSSMMLRTSTWCGSPTSSSIKQSRSGLGNWLRLVGHHFDFQGPTVERQPPVSEGVRGQRVPAQQEDQLRHRLPLGL